ncbi:MAG: PepSY domain-containing protein [Methyloligellaceae bacterium]
MSSESPDQTRRAFIATVAGGFCFLVCGQKAAAQNIRQNRRRYRQMGRRARERLLDRRDGSHLRARRALRNREIRPLREIIASVRKRGNVEILDVDLHQVEERWVYALRVVNPRGRLIDVFLNGKTLEIIRWQDSNAQSGVPLPRDLMPLNREIEEPLVDPQDNLPLPRRNLQR